MKIYISEKYLDKDLLSDNSKMVVGSDFDILSAVGADGDGCYVLAEVKTETGVETIEKHNKDLLQELYMRVNKHAQEMFGEGDYSTITIYEFKEIINKLHSEKRGK